MNRVTTLGSFKFWIWMQAAIGLLLLMGIGGMSYYRFIQSRYSHNNAYHIVAIIQSCQNGEALKTSFLAEYLDLSMNRPKNLYAMNVKEIRNKLAALPMIKGVKVKKIPPGTLYIDYQLRIPTAYLSEISNTVIDEEGVPFPLNPFFTPKQLPEIYLGIDSLGNPSQLDRLWGTRLPHKNLDLAFEFYHYVNTHYCSSSTRLRKIDVSECNALSCGQREIVLMLEDRMEKNIEGKQVLVVYPQILRLDPQDYKQGLANYGMLKTQLLDQSPVLNKEKVISQPLMTIDLRSSQLAFIRKS